VPIGLVAGAVAPLAIEQLQLRLLIDQPGGAVSVHAICAIWGILAPRLFAGGNRDGDAAGFRAPATL
jgi:ammonia channel protein AmtB